MRDAYTMTPTTEIRRQLPVHALATCPRPPRRSAWPERIEQVLPNVALGIASMTLFTVAVGLAAYLAWC